MVLLVDDIELANCVTHNGTIHADEVFATAFLDLYLGDLKVYRTSFIDYSKLNANALVYDIGRGKFDHHQADLVKRDNSIPYSSFGLLWKEFGRTFLEKIGMVNIEELFLEIDTDFIEGIDADDNGIFPSIDANYKVKTLAHIIKIFNPSYESGELEGDQFLKAVDVAKKIFMEEVMYVNGKILARKKAIELISQIDLQSKCLILDTYLPYEEALLNCSNANNILFVAYPSNRGGYAIKAVPKSIEDRSLRQSFPEEWAGLSQDELERVSGISGLLFCHAGRFIVNCRDLNTVNIILNKLCK